MNIIEKFWKDFLIDKNLPNELTYLESFHFDNTEKSANNLLKLVLEGKKCATASSLAYYEVTKERIPQPHDYSIVTDFYGKPYCVIETIATQILAFKDITYTICKREGEDENLDSWRTNHIAFFTREGEMVGYKFTQDMMVVFEDFRVVYQIA